MKKIVCIAIIAMSGIVLVSCDADGVESTAPQFGKLSNKKGIHNLTGRIEDSIPTDTTMINQLIDPPGPGDDLPPITPPKP